MQRHRHPDAETLLRKKRHAPGRFLWISVLVMCFTSHGVAAVLHVNPNGDDAATGDAAHPFQTISHAADWAAPGDVVMIAPGIYRESVALTHSGQPNKPITYQAEQPGTTIITGADVLTIWTPVPNHPDQYITDWPHDFIIDHNPDGSPIRFHGAPAPVGCAEQVLWETHPLQQVMKSDELVPGSFFVDWEYHTLTIWLPGGVDPRVASVEGSVRSDLFSPMEKDDVYSDVRFITLKGLVFRDAANFAQRGGVILGTGWHAEDCTIENNNAGGLSLNGDDILVKHCIAQFNGFCGISGSGNNNTLEDCIVRGNNRKGFSPDWEGGGGKFCRTNHLRVVRHLSYENTGPGIWLDTDNINYSITDSTFYGNHGLADDRQGCGIYFEINPGPGVAMNNIIYSNTGGGFHLAESEHITVENNTLVDNGIGIELRAMSGRDNYHLQFIDITRNRFKEWRKTAISTSLGEWSAKSVAERSIKIDGNFYDPPHDRPFVSWADSPLAGLPEIRSALGLESDGSVESIPFSHPLENARAIADPDRPTIAKAMENAAAGKIVILPACSRSSLGDDNRCAIFDQENACVALTVPTADLRQRLQTLVSTWPAAVPVLLEVRIDQAQPNRDFRATLLSVR